jgi:hypothetical protein
VVEEVCSGGGEIDPRWRGGDHVMLMVLLRMIEESHAATVRSLCSIG